MGTYFTPGASKAALVAELLRDNNVEAHDLSGNRLWCLIPSTRDGKPWKYVCLFKLVDGGRDGWGYKPISEDMGPCYYDCPLSYVKAVEPFEPLAYAREWRDKVYLHHGRQPPNKNQGEMFA